MAPNSFDICNDAITVRVGFAGRRLHKEINGHF